MSFSKSAQSAFTAQDSLRAISVPQSMRFRLTSIERLYLLLCFAIYFCWAAVFVSSTYGPDEVMRVQVPQFIARNGSLPFGWEPQLIDNVWGFSYAFQMKLPYLIGGLFIWVAERFVKTAAGILIAVRMISVFCMTGVAYYSIKISRYATASPWRWTFIFLLTLAPQCIFLASYYNLETYTLLTVLMIIDAWTVCLRTKWNNKSCSYLGFSMGLCVLGYEYAYSFIFASAILYLSWNFLHRNELTGRCFLLRGCLIVFVFLLICGWYFVRNFILYNGEIFAYKIQNIYGEKYAIDRLKPSLRSTPQHRGMSIIDMLLHTDWIKTTIKSSYGVLGYLNLFLPRFFYWFYAIFLFLGCFAFALFRIKTPAKQNYVLINAALATAALITVGLSLYASWARDYQPQGRYVLYALVPVYMIAAAGWHHLSKWLCRKMGLKPKAIQRFLTCTVVFIVCGSTATAFILCLNRFVWPTLQ